MLASRTTTMMISSPMASSSAGFVVLRRAPKTTTTTTTTTTMTTLVKRVKSTSAAFAESSSAYQAVPNNNKSLIFRALDWYSKKLDSSPLLTKGITGGLIAGMGDVLCQGVIEVKEEFNPVRTFRFSLAGALYIAPGIHYWYQALATRLAPGTTAMAVAKRVAYDQFVFSPVFLAGFLSVLWGMEGPEDAAKIPDRLQATLPDLVVANWTLWIPAQIVNFGFVPVKYQVLFNNALGLLWNAYVSWSASATEHEEEQQQQQQ